VGQNAWIGEITEGVIDVDSGMFDLKEKERLLEQIPEFKEIPIEQIGRRR
jgi:hypothetical protein